MGIRTKTDVAGNFIEAEARWVARGFQQVRGIDYDETYAATVRPDTTRTLLAIAAVKGWKVHQADIFVAYLHAHQKDYQIYLRQPKGFEHGNGDLYCRMDKDLYGLKQSGNLWFDEAAGTLIDGLGLTQSKYDLALFFDKKNQLFITLYVDDFKAISPGEKVIKWFMKEFGSIYKIKDLGLVSNYLGMEITQANGTIKVTQQRYLQRVLERFQMKDCKPAKTPMEEWIKLYKADKDYEYNHADRKLYQELEGSLMHLSVQTRPNITYAVNKLGRFASNQRSNIGPHSDESCDISKAQRLNLRH